jgi:L-ascorbate metabolism protein UlaG (beta-lactamase superfamily)
MTLTYYGHSAFQIETDEARLLVDPFLTGNRHAEGVVSPDELLPDVLLLTHAHGDHYGDTETIVRRARPQVVAPFEVVQYVAKQTGHEDGFGMNVGGSYRFPWGRLTMTDARHSSSFPDGTYGGPATGFVLEAGGKVLYNTGDTCRFAGMQYVAERFPEIDLLALPVGDVFTMGPDEALEVVKLFRPRAVLPLHYGTFPPIEVDVEAFAEAVRAEGIAAHVPAPGGRVEV